MAAPPGPLIAPDSVLNLRLALTVVVVAGYIAVCRLLRYARRDTEHAQRPYRSREDFQKMTAEDAWQIVKYIQSCEFPWISKKALSFALFKYGYFGNKPTHVLNTM